MAQCPFTVRQRDDTRWHVYETGSPRSLASFGLKEDAVDYALDLAHSIPAATPGPLTAVRDERVRA